nr:hypothetical protein [uncultured Actinoplanes sp.]
MDDIAVRGTRSACSLPISVRRWPVCPREAVAALVRAQLEYIRRYRAFAQLLLSEM